MAKPKKSEASASTTVATLPMGGPIAEQTEHARALRARRAAGRDPDLRRILAAREALEAEVAALKAQLAELQASATE